jgi:hypothetical protein
VSETPSQPGTPIRRWFNAGVLTAAGLLTAGALLSGLAAWVPWTPRTYEWVKDHAPWLVSLFALFAAIAAYLGLRRQIRSQEIQLAQVRRQSDLLIYDNLSRNLNGAQWRAMQLRELRQKVSNMIPWADAETAALFQVVDVLREVGGSLMHPPTPVIMRTDREIEFANMLDKTTRHMLAYANHALGEDRQNGHQTRRDATPVRAELEEFLYSAAQIVLQERRELIDRLKFYEHHRHAP